MQPILIKNGEFIHYGLNNYTDNHRSYPYQYGNAVYYFSVHNVPKKSDDGFIFNNDQKLIVLLHPKGLISFKMTKMEDQWQPDASVLKTISPDILELIKQKLVFRLKIR